MKLLNFITSPSEPTLTANCDCCGNPATSVRKFYQTYGLSGTESTNLCKKCEALARKISVSSFAINENHWKFLIQEARKP